MRNITLPMQKGLMSRVAEAGERRGCIEIQREGRRRRRRFCYEKNFCNLRQLFGK
jgi:hypothetical protein